MFHIVISLSMHTSTRNKLHDEELVKSFELIYIFPADKHLHINMIETCTCVCLLAPAKQLNHVMLMNK